MEIFYIIKNITLDQYLSVNDYWDNWSMCKEFKTKQDAVHEIKTNSLSMCIIKKVYRS